MSSNVPDLMEGPAGFSGALLRLLSPLSSSASVIGTLWILFIMLVINTDVLGRQLFNYPVQSVPEIISHSVVAIVFLQLTETQKKGRLIRSDLLLRTVLTKYPRIGFLLLSFHNLLGALVMGTLFYYTVPRLLKAFERAEYVGTLGSLTFPLWPLIAIVAFSSGVAALFYLIHMVNPKYAKSVELEDVSHG